MKALLGVVVGCLAWAGFCLYLPIVLGRYFDWHWVLTLVAIIAHIVIWDSIADHFKDD